MDQPLMDFIAENPAFLVVIIIIGMLVILGFIFEGLWHSSWFQFPEQKKARKTREDCSKTHILESNGYKKNGDEMDDDHHAQKIERLEWNMKDCSEKLARLCDSVEKMTRVLDPSGVVSNGSSFRNQLYKTTDPIQ